MAVITRCDECKKLSDEQGVGFIGRAWQLKRYRETLMNIQTIKDLCRDCVKKQIEEHALQKQQKEEY